MIALERALVERVRKNLRFLTVLSSAFPSGCKFRAKLIRGPEPMAGCRWLVLVGGSRIDLRSEYLAFTATPAASNRHHLSTLILNSRRLTDLMTGD